MEIKGCFIIISKLISSKKGKLYLKFIIANTNGTTINSVQIANASVARAADQLFGFANFSSDILTSVRRLPSISSATNGTFEENSMSEIRDFRASSEAEASETFKWLKRTIYQPQNRWKLDGDGYAC